MEPKKRIRSLIVEDSEDDALLVIRELRQGGFEPEFLRVDAPDSLRRALAGRAWDVVLSDYRMPGFSGADALRIAKEHDPDLPFILISGTIGEESAVAMMKAGAADYLLKDSLGRLVPAVERELLDAGRRREQRLQHNALRESEEKFSKAFRQAPLLITLSEIDTGKYIDVNEKFLSVTGFTRGEVIGRTSVGIGWITNEQRSRLVNELRDRGRVSALELSLRGKNGNEVVCLINGEMITLGGEPRLLTMAQDITERTAAAEKLRRSEEYIRNILDTVDEGFIVVDRRYRILTANKAYCDQVGLPAVEVIGKHCYEVSHGTMVPCYEEGEDCVVRRVFDTGAPRVVVHKHGKGGEAMIFAETKAYPLRNDDGEIVSVIETINNVTEKHLLEDERLKTQKLEAIGTLAGGIAHDFNNLLQGVFGYISMAKMSLDQKARASAMLEQAEKALNLSVSLTSQLLTFSKGGKPVRRKLALRPVIENAVKFALSGSRLDYRIDIDARLRPVEADEGQIGQVIQNIVLNADQAMPGGGVVTIEARNVRSRDPGVPATLDEGAFVEISIRDNGIGIPAEFQARIFDPYFTTKEKGSGLGLATSYSIIRNHDGLIDVKSETGKGSTFTLYLPAVEPDAPEGGQQPAATQAVRRGRILVMDDEEIVRMVAKELISMLGHEVDLAEHGAVAVEKYQRAREAGRSYDVVILDLTIRGGMGGLETARRLRELDPGVKAVVSSGYSDDAVTAEYETHGFRAFLKKPYDIDALKQTLSALLP